MEIEDLKKDLTSVAETVKEMGKAMEGLSSMGEIMKGLQAELKGLKEKPKEEKKEKKKSDQGYNIELMSRAEFQGHLMDKFQEILEEKLAPLGEQVKTVDSTVRTTNIHKALEQAKKKHPDFMEWKEEMIDLANQIPGISPERAYHLVKAEHPDKAKTLKEKFKSPEEKEAEAKKAEPKKPAFGGLTPTSGEISEESKNLSKKDAAELAWQKVFGAES